MKTTRIESFPTIDLCVDYLTRVMGCKWDSEKEQILLKQQAYKYLNVLVMYDPYELLKKY